MYEIKLGDKVVETVTGFKGTVIAIAKYLTGHESCMVQPPCNANGEFIKSLWFETCQLEPQDEDQ